MDSIGGSLDAFTAKELVCYNIKVLDEHLPQAFDVLADLVLHPLFRDEDIEKEKGVILEELKMEVDNPEYLVHEIFSANFWKDHPLGKPILGTRADRQRFDREMIEDYYRAVYAPVEHAGDGGRQPDARAAGGPGARAFRSAAAGTAAAARPRSRARTRASRCATRNRWSRCICTWACRPIRCRTRSASPATS